MKPDEQQVGGSARPALIGRHRVVREIGRGSMGVVYLGHDPLYQRAVALKVAHEPAYRDEPGRQLFRNLFFNEMRAARILSHPNIVEVLDAGVDGAVYFIAMEYVDGGRTLENWCVADALLPIDEALRMVAHCAHALDYAHRRGVIHRDIKPRNILVSPAHDVKLADFSVALLTDPAVDATQLMSPVGSPLYMSPEQFRSESVTNQSDLFSLGNVLYELLTGRLPFAADTLAGVTHNVLSRKPAPVRRWREGVPDGVEHIVSKALARETADRFATALDFAHAVEALLSEVTTVNVPERRSGRVQRIASLAFFGEFDEPELWELLRWCEWLEFAADDTVLRAGERDGAVYFVVEGGLRAGQRTVLIGEALNERACLGPQVLAQDVMAASAATVLRVNQGHLSLATLSCQLAFQRALLRSVFDRSDP